ncbi:MAG: hypothetical protein CMJ18_26445 [Phycisphaeraceae bacterium]|nr:hypothetical protein [Phycisphaeraceae bacterium]
MNRTSIRALLVEDNPGDAQLIRTYLRDAGGTDGFEVDLTHVDRLSQALRLLEDDQTDVLLLDLALPDSTGSATLEEVRRKNQDLPVVVLTGQSNTRVALRAVEQGAEDYLVKGHLDGDRLLRAIRYAIVRSEHRRTERALMMYQKELQVAWKIQHSLYPDASPLLAGCHVAGASYPAETVGGDYYDYIPMRDEQFGVVIGDASGHGIGPAMLMAEARATLRTLAQTYRGVDEIVTIANRILIEGMLDNHFITLILVRLDPHRQTLEYASAGHPPGYVFDAAGHVVIELDSTNMPIGILPDEQFSSSGPVQLERGQIVLLLTDGVLEAGRPGRKPFGPDRVKAVVREHRRLSPSLIVDALYRRILEYCHPNLPHDDMTMIVIKIDHDEAGLPMQAAAAEAADT